MVIGRINSEYKTLTHVINTIFLLLYNINNSLLNEFRRITTKFTSHQRPKLYFFSACKANTNLDLVFHLMVPINLTRLDSEKL